MTTFAIQYGATPLCEWNLDTGELSTHERAVLRDDILVLPEDMRVGFTLGPATHGSEYRISIGDVPLTDIAPTADDAAGILIGGSVFWRDLAYFDSARAHTELVLERRSDDVADRRWLVLLSVDLYVLPTKVGEDRYGAMGADLRRVSHSLLSDLYGKSRRSVDIRYAREGQPHHSREAELRAIEGTLGRIEILLQSIARRPSSRIVTTTYPKQYWGAQRLHPAAIEALARRGTDLRAAPRPVNIVSRMKTESFDVPEHRIIKAFLSLLLRRCTYCGDAATAHSRAIASERHLRDIRMGEGPSLYESVDMPRIAKLHTEMANARRCETLVMALTRLSYLRDVPAAFSSPRGGVFDRNNDYRALLVIIRRFLLEHAQWYEGDDYSSITKLTWRMFEQWTFLRIIDAFRHAGLELREWTDTLRQNLRSRFLVDFDRGLMFEGLAGHGLRLRFRYEPWILGHSSAVQAQETLHRGRSGEVAWSPDVVIECLRQKDGEWVTVYAIVLDCKYTPRVTNQHWSGITKYLEIRSTDTGRQVAKQLWLVCPNEIAQISSEDPTVEFSNAGPSCDADEAVRFRLAVTPVSLIDEVESGIAVNSFALFAEGTLAFLLRNFGGVSSGITA